METNDILSNIASSKNKQYGAHNSTNSFTTIAASNVGTLADTMQLNVEGEALVSIKWSEKKIVNGPFPQYHINGLSFTKKTDKKYCLVQYRYNHSYYDPHWPGPGTIVKDGIAYALILITDDNNITADVYNGYVTPNSAITQTTPSDFNYYSTTFSKVAERDTEKTSFNNFIADTHTNDLYTLETKTYFQALNVALIGVKDNLNAVLGDPYFRFAGAYGSTASGVDNLVVRSLLKTDPDIPVFDISNYENIVKYLVDGEIVEPMGEGEFTPAISDTDAGYKLPDYTTTWDIYITPGDDGNGRAVFTAFNEMAEELGDAPRSKVKLVYAVDPKGGRLFDSKYVYKEKLYGESFGVNLSDLARDMGTDAWLNANNDPKGQHVICGMLYTGGENSLAFRFQFDFANTDTGIAFVPGKTVTYMKSAIAPVGDWVEQATTETQTEFGYTYTNLYGDIVNLHINETYEGGNDSYSTDKGAQYNPDTDTYGGLDVEAHGRIGSYRIYRLTEQQLKDIFNQFNSYSSTTWNSSIWGSNLWSCLKSLKLINIPNNTSLGLTNFTVGNITVGSEQYIQTTACTLIDCGSITNIARKYENFLDYSPYTMFYIHLPYVGYVSLPADEIYNCTLKFQLAVDYVSGEAMYFISRNGCVRWNYSCKLGADIPLDTNNNITALNRGLMSMFGASGLMSASLDYSNQVMDKSRVIDSASGFNVQFDSTSIFYLMEYPKAQLPTSSPHDVGRPCGLTKTLSSLRGFTKCKNVDVSGYNCTNEERKELISILETGFYL